MFPNFGRAVAWMPSNVDSWEEGVFVATFYNFMPCRLVFAGGTLGCVGRCKRSFQRDVSMEVKRHCCLARRSLTAAGVRLTGGIQQRFGDVGCWCHMLSSESLVHGVPSSPIPHQCSAERSTGLFCRNVYSVVACPSVVNYSSVPFCERTDKLANFCRPAL